MGSHRRTSFYRKYSVIGNRRKRLRNKSTFRYIANCHHDTEMSIFDSKVGCLDDGSRQSSTDFQNTAWDWWWRPSWQRLVTCHTCSSKRSDRKRKISSRSGCFWLQPDYIRDRDWETDRCPTSSSTSRYSIPWAWILYQEGGWRPIGKNVERAWKRRR